MWEQTNLDHKFLQDHIITGVMQTAIHRFGRKAARTAAHRAARHLQRRSNEKRTTIVPKHIRLDIHQLLLRV
jgi:hypothetical protein